MYVITMGIQMKSYVSFCISSNLNVNQNVNRNVPEARQMTVQGLTHLWVYYLVHGMVAWVGVEGCLQWNNDVWDQVGEEESISWSRDADETPGHGLVSLGPQTPVQPVPLHHAPKYTTTTSKRATFNQDGGASWWAPLSHTYLLREDLDSTIQALSQEPKG
jgi:hypothetical protein